MELVLCKSGELFLFSVCVGNKQRRQSENTRKQKRDPYIRKEPDHGADFITYKDRHAPGYPGSTVGHPNHVYNTVSGSKRPYADMVNLYSLSHTLGPFHGFLEVLSLLESKVKCS